MILITFIVTCTVNRPHSRLIYLVQNVKMAQIAREKAEKSMRDIDFNNPTPKMVEDAKKQGIDLMDDRVVQMLNNMQEEKSLGKEAQQKQTHDKLHDLVSELTKDQVILALKEMGEGTKEELKGRDYTLLKSTLVGALLNGKEFPMELLNAKNGGEF